jgi:hypothetical protein
MIFRLTIQTTNCCPFNVHDEADPQCNKRYTHVHSTVQLQCTTLLAPAGSRDLLQLRVAGAPLKSNISMSLIPLQSVFLLLSIGSPEVTIAL